MMKRSRSSMRPLQRYGRVLIWSYGVLDFLEVIELKESWQLACGAHYMTLLSGVTVAGNQIVLRVSQHARGQFPTFQPV